jgi:hypothetical protein
MILSHGQRFLAWALLLPAFAFCKATSAQLAPYDNFNSKRIDPSKWIGWQFFDPDVREATRELTGEERNRRLHLSQTAYSATTDDSGGSGGTFGLAFPDPNAVTEISFTVVVNKAEAIGCSSNDALIVTDAEFRGNFFNVGSAPTSSIGDVVGVISVARSPTDVGDDLTVAGFYTRCDDEFCGSQTALDYRELGKVQPGVASTLRIKWDQPGHRFVFQLNHEPEVISPYTVSDTSPAFFPNKTIGSARSIPHCTTQPRPFTSMDASFKRVRANR